MVPTETPFTRALSTPHTFINDISRTLSSDPSASTSALPSAVSAAFREAFPRGETLSKVPFLTVDNVDHLMGKTVRWTCMVQDNSLGNEIVLSRIGTGSHARCALFGGDSVQIDEEQEQGGGDETSTSAAAPSSAELTERAVLYGTSLPGRSSWAAEADRQGRDVCSSSSSSTTFSSGSTSNTTTTTTDRGIKSKLPYPDDGQSLGVMLKMYDLEEAEALQVTDLIEVVGVLDQSTFANSDADWDAGAVGTSSGSNGTQGQKADEVFPSLHVVFHRKVSDVWATGEDKQEEANGHEINTKVEADTTTRENLVSYLAQELDGDKTAAQWLLLNLISSIHTRRAPFALGHLSLRLLTSVPTTNLASALSSLVPSLASFPVTLSTLNDKSTHLYPQSTPTSTTGLSSSLLQLPKSSHCFIRESINEGQLDQHGLTNLQTLQNVLRNSTLGYVFPYLAQPFEMPVDFGVLVLSETEQGASGLVKCDVDVVVRGDSSGSGSGRGTQSAVDLTSLRRHIAKARKLARTLHVPQSVAEQIQTHFVQSRQEQQQKQQRATTSQGGGAAAAATDNQEDLHATLLRHMDVARLIAASHLRKELTIEDYQLAKRLDEERCAALEDLRRAKRAQRAV